MIPYGHQEITEGDVEAVVSVLRSELITQGPAVPRFETEVAEYCGAEHAVAVNSGTSALHVACMALGLGPGDTLWTVPNTFVASANCGRYCGADVDFVDIDPESWNISIEALRKKLMRAKREGRLPKVVVPVHFAGLPVEQEAIWELALEFGFKVLEDAAHALGARRHGELVGSCRWCHIAVLSFHPVKIITTGEGGMALTNDSELAWRMASLRTHGITRERSRMTREPEGPWSYEQLALGYNYRMTDLQAALGLSQLPRLPRYIERRNQIASRYSALLQDLPLKLPLTTPHVQSAFHLYVTRLKSDRVRKTRRDVFEAMFAQGIGVNLHYTPVHLQPYYRQLGFGPELCPEAERYAADALTLPIYPGLSDEQQDYIAAALRRSLT